MVDALYIYIQHITASRALVLHLIIHSGMVTLAWKVGHSTDTRGGMKDVTEMVVDSSLRYFYVSHASGVSRIDTSTPVWRAQVLPFTARHTKLDHISWILQNHLLVVSEGSCSLHLLNLETKNSTQLCCM